MNIKDYRRLVRIIDCCFEINEMIQKIEGSKEIFINDKDYQRAIVFTLIEIGEIAKCFSDEFISETSGEFPWSAVINYRDKYVEEFVTINVDLDWTTATKDIAVITSLGIKNVMEYRALRDNPAPSRPN
jgi:uncharacterized protein with HEPN domain